jgi:MoxR-like ATPase
VRRLRRAGLAVSDRRAVKLQRPIAASALLAGRARAAPSDLWVLRHVWDTDEQRELLAGVVDESLARNPDGEGVAAHPRARASDEPDADALARELERLEAQAAEPGAREALADRLSALAGRSAWVRDESARTFLERRVEALWRALDGPA